MASAAHRGAEGRPAKRHRITIACTWCRQRKSRCDGVRPSCSVCKENGSDCVYSNAISLTKSTASKEYIEALESRLAALENSLGGLSTRVTCIEGRKGDDASTICSSHQSASTFTSDHFGDDDDERGRASLQDPTDGIGSIVFTKEEDFGFFGPSSNIAFTRQIVRATTATLKALTSATSPESPNESAIRSHMLHVSRPPSPSLNGYKISNNTSVGIEPFVLPPAPETVRLVDLFFSTTGMLYPYIHKETFLETYRKATSTNIRAVRRSWLGLLNMVLAMSTSVTNFSPNSASERAAESDIFFRRASSLCETPSRHGASLEVVQLLLLMSQYLQGTERSIETWNVHGLAVKAAYQLGLHSPNAINQYPPLEREFRKRAWFGCVVLDRTLSMTMGRPCSIPESYVKLELPCALMDSRSSRNDPVNLALDPTDQDCVLFFKSTIALYRIMGEVVDVLYGSNLGCIVPDDVFSIASHVLQLEHRFLAWQSNLPDSMSLIDPEILSTSTDSDSMLRFRIILTLRYLNLRILTHRPLLCMDLEALGSSTAGSQQLAMLRQVGTNSVRICAQSALMIIRLMRAVLSATGPARHLLGAWWFSLYYAFNAALVIYATLLVQHQAKIRNHALALEDLDISMETLQQAIECLSLLFKGNRMTERCVRYTSALAHTLSSIFQSNAPLEANLADVSFNIMGAGFAQRSSEDADTRELLDFFDLTDLHMGVDLGDLVSPSCFDFAATLPDSTFASDGRSQ